MSRPWSVAIASAVLALTAVWSSASQAQSYTALDLGDLSGRAINDSGQVAGFLGSMAAYTGPNGLGVTLVSTPYNGSGAGLQINNQGTVTGAYFTPAGTLNDHGFDFGAFVVTPGGQTGQFVNTDLGIMDGTSGLNNRGQVAGWVGPDSVVADLATGQTRVITGVFNSSITAMNDQGWVVGSASPLADTYDYMAFVADANGVGQFINLGNANGSMASDINNQGWIVGGAGIVGTTYHAYVSKDAQSFTELLPQAVFSAAQAINDSGVIVGQMVMVEGDNYRAFVTGPGAQGVFDLNTLVQLDSGATIFSAWDINASGQILVTADDNHSYLLTPTAAAIPEPGTWALWVLGLVGLGIASKRQRH